MSSTRRHNRKMENIALIAQLLGGLGQGIAGFQGARQAATDREEKKATEAKRLQMEQDRLDLEGEQVDTARENAKAARQREWRAQMNEAGDRPLRRRLMESQAAENEAHADYMRSGGGRKDPSAPGEAAMKELWSVASELGVDPNSPDAIDKIQGALKKAQVGPDGPGGDLASALWALSHGDKADKQAMRYASAAGTLQRMRGSRTSQGVGPVGMQGDMGQPQAQPQPGQVASDTQGQGDLLNIYGHVMGALQRGADASSPLFDPIWHGVGQMFPHLVPDAVRMRQQGVNPSTGMR